MSSKRKVEQEEERWAATVEGGSRLALDRLRPWLPSTEFSDYYREPTEPRLIPNVCPHAAL
jgi:hypothetical protein